MSSLSEKSTFDPRAAQATTGLNTESHSAQAKAGLGGCLLYPLLFLIVQPIAFVVMLLNPRDSTYFVPPGYSVSYRIFWPNLIMDLVLVGAMLLLLVMFLRKKKILPSLFIATLLILYTGATVVAIIVQRPAGVGDPIRTVMVLFVQCLILIPYFVLADRVKNTFVQELNPSSWLERPLARFTGLLDRLYGWLGRRRRTVTWMVLGYLIVVFMLGATLDSLLK
jgi:hypothetical protein